MEPISENANACRLKHSRLGIIAFIFFVLSLLPIFFFVFTYFFPELEMRVLPLFYDQALLLAVVLLVIIVLFSIISITLTIIDLIKKSNLQ